VCSISGRIIPRYDSTRDRTHDLPHSGEHANIPWYDSTRDRTHDLPHSGEHANIPWYDSTRDRTHDLPHSGEHANIPWYDSTRDRTHDLPHSGEHANVGSISGRIIPRNIKLVIAASLLNIHHSRVRVKTGWLKHRIMYASGATCLPVDCCFSQLCLKTHQKASKCNLFSSVWARFMRFDAPFNKTSAISWRSILLMKETGVPGENYRIVPSHWQTLSHNFVSSIHRIVPTVMCLVFLCPLYYRGSRDRMVVWFTTTCAMSAYYH
jgi:hypothetical protein